MTRVAVFGNRIALSDTHLMLFRLAAFFSLACLSGCWVSFPLGTGKMRWWTKFFLGAALSPIVLVLQFYTLRIVGLSFERSALILACLNVLPLYPMLRARRGALPSAGTLAGLILILGITGLTLAPQFMNRYSVVYSTHSWMHAAADYLYANGQTMLEEPDLAGVRLAYPWGGYAFQALLSYVLNSTPAYSYEWTNLLWVVVCYGLAVAVAHQFGLRSFQAAFAPVWLFFGVNFAGAVVHHIAPYKFAWIGGDFRYATWVWYFICPTQMLFAIAMFLALTILMTQPSFLAHTGKNLALVFLLLLGTGFVYPVLFPAIAALPVGRVVAETIGVSKSNIRLARVLSLAGVTAGAALITSAYLAMITHDRVTSALFFSKMSPVGETLHAATPPGKLLECLVALSPLLAGLWCYARRSWNEEKTSIITLTAGAIVSVACYSLLFLPYFQNEYKFVFTAASALAVFPALALKPLFDQLGKKLIPAAAALTILLAAPMFPKMYRYGQFWVSPHGPLVHTDDFNLRLDKSNRFAEVTDAIRSRTSIDTIVVAEDGGVYYPVLTRRQLFVAPRAAKAYPGVAIGEDILLENVKGYDKSLIDKRRSVTDGIFHSADLRQISSSIDAVMELKRPVVILVDLQRCPTLQNLLAQLKRGSPVFEGSDTAAWLFQPGLGTSNGLSSIGDQPAASSQM
jgi:hypothetical protein